MSNKITEKYFKYNNSIDDFNEIIKEILAKTNFQPEREIFRGQIYDSDKVGSLIYQGVWQDKPAVLKIQKLQPDIDEIEMIDRFNQQNESSKIRLPKLYNGLEWNKNDGYGYLISEYIGGMPIYQSPLAKQSQIQDFGNFYQEYKTKCLRRPWIEKEPNEQSSLLFTTQRVSHWAQIAQSKDNLNEIEIKNVEKFLSLAGQHLPSIKIEFTHGHLSSNDIFKLSNNEYVLMSNLFWSYRPEFYDATFHLWWGIKSLRNTEITVEQIIDYLQQWIKEYKKLPIIAQDSDFERKFNLMMAERCIGATLLDIQAQNYEHNRDKFVTHLTNLFRELFDYLANRL